MSHGAITHGHTWAGGCTPEYSTWRSMKNRCTNPKDPKWRLYGGAGIKVCRRWRRFENFLSDMGPRPSRYHSIDRIDGSGHYRPGNCRWATSTEQNRNRSTSVFVTVEGRTRCIAEWASIVGISDVSFRRRTRLWPVSRWLEPPTDPHKRHALCRRGLHPLAGDNVYTRPDGSNHCRACRKVTELIRGKVRT